MSNSSLAVDISRIEGGERQSFADDVAVEEPLEIRLGYSTADGRASKSISITMRTPGEDFELAAGFLLSESIVADKDDIISIDYCGAVTAGGSRNSVRVELGADVAVDISRLQRHFYTTSSCGVCGKASLEVLHATGVESLSGNATAFSRATVSTLPTALRQRQDTFDKTGGLHAAAAFTAAGEIVYVREDIGRHNAVDKVVGRLLLDGRIPASDLGLMVSGRASFELTQKALCAGMPLLAAVSAPSSLAVELAREFDMTLIGFLREERFNVYSGEQRVAST